MSERVRGATGVSLSFRLTDVTTGAARTGLDVTSLRLQFARPVEAPSAATSLTLLGSQTAAFTAFGAVEKDGTNSPGVYRVDTPNAAYLAGADEVTLTVTGAAIQPATRLIDLVTLDARAANPPADWLNGNAVKADAVTKVQAAVAAGSVASVVNLAPVPVPTGTVAAVASGTQFTASGLNAAAGAYNPTAKRTRAVLWLTGANASETNTVASYAGAGAFTLDVAPTNTIANGDTFIVL